MGRILGLDPGLRHTGWGVVEVAGNRLTHVADGAVSSDDDAPLAERLNQLYDGLVAVIDRFGARRGGGRGDLRQQEPSRR